ncbi:LruC domain-containing protein [Mucilaginibacter limnophilus]|uniref:LruC domain-containing protein n=1 Tax=Mucilaginibacter limnophilus TaxID=1932778 RepID=A0A3S2UM77_9SPHI|nr:LruC domain-containing protein [Mucilaginibacter limnophilus]RVU01762.1 LruC domain-containing protein [Mucilaginibacter limnophilus]
MKKLNTLLLILSIVGFTACKKDSNTPDNDGGVVTPDTKIAPDGFNFKTSKDVSLDITLHSNNNQALEGVVVSVFDPSNTEAPIYRGVTDASGKLRGKVTVPAYLTQLIIDPAYVGLIRNAKANINGSSTTVVLGGSEGFSGDIVPEEVTFKQTNGLHTNGLLGIDFLYPTGYTASNAFVSPTNLGRPAYLLSTGDVIDASLLSYINASLPEGTPLTTTHPEYLTSTVTSTINVKAKSDVWITFVSEGAGYKNALGYYTYRTSNPPSQVTGGTLLNGIDDITYVFPNASASGSGGGLKSGDKVKLGTFEAGTTIAFVLFQDAWTGTGVNTGAAKFYSNDKFNPESTVATRKHSVVLYDDVHKLFLMGFEDINRQNGSDNDFNDLVVYATANPITAISNEGVAIIDDGGDKDGDGVLDELDAFPNDGTKAYISYYPSANTYAQVAFEDNWPYKGDYDLNDLVVNYRYTFVSNAKNQVVTLTGDYIAMAAGASFKNGFGVQLPVAASAVASVTGQNITGNYITRASNGVESGQSKAVIIPFDNHDNVIRYPDNSFLINTVPTKDKVAGSTTTVTVTFASPVDQANLAASSFNPFLISNLRRGYEVHLPGYAPTDKADTKLFKTGDDASVPGSGKYYLSNENWPWAIGYTTAIQYPIEEASITKAYLHFAEWAQSGGTSFTDWYSNTASGYRNNSFIYSK